MERRLAAILAAEVVGYSRPFSSSMERTCSQASFVTSSSSTQNARYRALRVEEEKAVITTDPYGKTDRLDETSLEVIVARLEARGKHPFFDRMLREYLDAMEIDAAETVLDMGCGTGVAARAIARRPDFTGTVLGIDLGPFLVDGNPARRRGGVRR